MKITIEAELKEIAAFVPELQKRLETNYELKVDLDHNETCRAVENILQVIEKAFERD